MVPEHWVFTWSPHKFVLQMHTVRDMNITTHINISK